MKSLLKLLPFLILAAVALPLGTPLCGIGAGYFMGYYPGVMQPLEKCALAGEILGDDIRVATLGMSCGTAETRGGFGIASWELPVEGSKESGEYSFYMERHGGAWQLMQAHLESGEQAVDVVNCRPIKIESGSPGVEIAPPGQRQPSYPGGLGRNRRNRW